MGERGPAPKPLSEKHRDGSYQGYRDGVETVECAIPDMPGDLSGRAQAFWQIVSQAAYQAGYITEVDGKLLRLMADSWELYLDACENIEERGILITELTGTGTRTKKNPAIDVRRDAYKEIERGLKQFGLSPSARVGMRSLHAEKFNDETDRINSILGIN